MTLRDVATYLALDENTVGRLARSGKLKGRIVRGAWKFARADVESFVEASRVVPGSMSNSMAGKSRG